MKGQRLYADIYYSIISFIAPYIQSKLTFLSKKHYYSLKMKHINSYLYNSSFFGVSIPTLFFVNTKNDIIAALAFAARGGNKKLCSTLMKYGGVITDTNWALSHAAYGGHIELMRFFIMNGECNLDFALASAAQSGHIDACFFLMQVGATDFNCALAYAAYGGHTDICRILIQAGATNLDWASRNAQDEETRNFLKQFTRATH